MNEKYSRFKRHRGEFGFGSDYAPFRLAYSAFPPAFASYRTLTNRTIDRMTCTKTLLPYPSAISHDRDEDKVVGRAPSGLA